MPLPPLNGLRAFEAAARTGSYVAAAHQLHVSPSAISRHVRLLEAHLGIALFERHAAGLTLTPRGAAYALELEGAFARLAQATDRAKEITPGALVIGAGPTLAMRWLIPRLQAFQDAHPDIEIRISTSIDDAHPMRPEWAAAIRMGDGSWPGFIARFLFTADLFPVTIPAVAKTLHKPGDLARATLLAASNAPADWPRWLAAAGLDASLMRRALRFDYPAFALQAALDGLGVAMARAPFVTDDLAAGRLVRPFKLSVPHGRGWYLIHRPAMANDPALGRFRDWLIDAAHAKPATRTRMTKRHPKRTGARPAS